MNYNIVISPFKPISASDNASRPRDRSRRGWVAPRERERLPRGAQDRGAIEACDESDPQALTSSTPPTTTAMTSARTRAVVR